ncbi:MAG: phosphoribosylformylglycinamidine cyclo-ligase [Bacteroidetes bacterium]|nr:phosphoribosylformylglycinamidine cyclo-ligase [Bacteroidota bacterium]
MTYKMAGVDIDAGEETVERIKPHVKKTFTPSVLSDLGSFGALFDARFQGYHEPVLVSSVDGVGTKLKVAQAMGIHSTIGQDLVNHCVNDILVCGAKPLFFLDYFSTGKLVPQTAESVIAGMATACKENGCALIGGETAEMPGIYDGEDYDLAGTIVGLAEKQLLLKRERVKEGDVMLAIPSTGLHTNGYSLARRVVLKKHEFTDYAPELGTSYGEALLAVHRSYFHSVFPLVEQKLINGMSHITGGGLIANTRRVIPDTLDLDVNWNSWERPVLFKVIQELGSVPEEDMRRTMNLGIGLVLIVDPQNAGRVQSHLESVGEKVLRIGQITKK